MGWKRDYTDAILGDGEVWAAAHGFKGDYRHIAVAPTRREANLYLVLAVEAIEKARRP